MVENGRKLNELRVCDLKTELERRKLDTVGAKATLVERLEKALKEEGLDPGKHIFTISGDRKKSLDTPTKKVPEVKAIIKEEPVEYVEEEVQNDENADYEIDQVGDVDDECIIIEDEMEEEEIPDEEEEYEEEGEGNQEGVEEEYEEPEEEEEEEGNENEAQEEEDADDTNHDNDESINLTIGEEEQQLLHDEAPDDKEKPAELNVSTKEKTTTTAVIEAKIEKVSPAKKVEKKTTSNSTSNNTKDKEKEKEKDKETKSSATKSKEKDEKRSGEKKDASEVKSSSSSSKTAQKDDKEKSSVNNAATQSSSTTAGNAAAASATTTTTTGTTASSGNTNNAPGKAAVVSSNAKNVSTSRNLWVSGLAAITRASDLKTIFSKYGKVIGAKVVTNTRTPGTRCYGYVTMSSSGDASRCIDHLHRTELHGRIISVERTKNEIGGSAATTNAAGVKDNAKHDPKRREDDKSKTTSSGRVRRESHNRDDKRKAPEAVNHRKENDANNKDRKRERDEKNERTTRPSKEAPGKSIRSRSQHKPQGGGGAVISGPPSRPPRVSNREQRDRVRQREILTYQKIREERDRQRLRERERELREEERRRREIRDRQRQEESRLAEERRKLAQERERLEREKAELLRLERERQKLEREKLELERLELKRQQMKIIQSRDDPINKPRHAKRSSTDRYAEAPERKRPAPVDSRFEAPPPPRFDTNLVAPRGSKRDDYVSSSSGSKQRHDAHDFGTVSTSSKPRGSDYSSSGGAPKRGNIDDFAVPAKRPTAGDYIKRTGADYVSTSSKRGIAAHRDEYSTKTSSRDDYKREADIRHLPVAATTASGSGGGPYHKSSSSVRYGDAERNANPSSYRRGGGIDDIRSSVSVSKRYETSSGGYGSTSGGGNNSGSSNLWNGSSGHMSSSGAPTLKSYVSNGMGSTGLHGASWQKPMSMDDSSWRSVPSSQDRYDRTYNERSTGYPISSSSNLYGSSNGRSIADRYTGPMSRY